VHYVSIDGLVNIIRRITEKEKLNFHEYSISEKIIMKKDKKVLALL